MLARLAADAVLLAHLAFIVFVLIGGILVWRIPSLAWLHAPAIAWAVFVESAGRICPLTPLENRLRLASGEAGYGGDFVSHYLLRLIYPEGLTRAVQIALVLVVVAVNVAVYSRWLLRKRTAQRSAMG
ncbi:MAG TPA: DUF2784 domain-containing protein [Casimicrobiaceae bacterium]|nr:DUF2784 domain-containing protein [Casimicrobiaceae bacterium]